MAKIKKILTFEDLINFCQEQNFNKFNYKESGYKISVQMPTTFEKIDDIDENNQGLMKLKFKIFHTGLNRNGSYVSEKAAKKAMKTIANRPILAAIHLLDDGETWDFAGHEMEIISNEKGEDELIYIEKQVGSFSSEPAYIEHDDVLDKDFICAYGYIPRDYTKAAEIIERKNGTKNSCELCINKFTYNAQEKYLELDDFYVDGSTLLGSYSDGTEIQEGMLGSRADIEKFSFDKNSIKFEKNDSLKRIIQDAVNTAIDNYIKADAENFSEEGGTEVENEIILNEEVTTEETEVFEETVEETVEETPVVETESVEEVTEETTTEETVTTEEEFSEDTTEVTPEEVVEDQAAQFEEELVHEDNKCKDDEDKENCSDEVKEENKCKKDNEVEEDEEVHDENKCKKNNEAEVKYSICVNGKTMEYSLSMNAKIEALSILVNDTYSEMDNTFYSIEAYEDHVIMVDYWTGRAFKQNYKCKKDTYSLVGDRVSVYAQYLTQDEINALENMKANYSSIETELSAYKEAEAYADKLTVFEDATYSQFLDSDEFKALMSKEVVDANTKEQLHDKAEIAFAKLVRANGSFELKEPEVIVEKKPSMFAFAKVETSTSFLDGLLNKKN